MNVIGVARAIGIDVSNGQVSGTIDEKNVLSALAELAVEDPENADLFDDAAALVRSARSAGVEQVPAGSMLAHPSDVATTQLRYRSEMAEIFTDLAIDVGLRHSRKLVPAV